MPIEFKILELIKRKHLEEKSWRELAEEIGISHGPLFQMAYNKRRKGKVYNPSLETLEKLCDYFHCPPGDLMRYEKRKK